jgi:methylenetetrahydrofolate reductase (NADPH)
MMALLNFKKRPKPPNAAPPRMSRRSAGLLDRGDAAHRREGRGFRALLPKGTRVYIAHIDGTPIEDMVATAKRAARRRLPRDAAFPGAHHQGRGHAGRLDRALSGRGGRDQALLLAGGVAQRPRAFHSSMQLLETGLFDKAGFTRLHVAGHPEGNRDIDPDGGDAR